MPRKNRIVVAALAAATAASVLSACGSASDAGVSSSAKNVVYLSPVGSQPGQQDILWAMTKAAKSLGWGVSVIDANLSPDKQVAGVDTAISQGRNAIASWSLDPGAVAAAYQRAGAANIPVVGVNSKGGPGVNANVVWENSVCVKGGQADRIADYYAKLRPGGTVANITGPPSPSSIASEKCLDAALKAKGLKIAAETANTADSSDAGSRIIADVLTAHPGIDIINCYNDATALGASSAVLAAGGKVASGTGSEGTVVVGSNADKTALDAIKDNRLTATWDPNNIATGYAIVHQMQLLMDGKKANDIVIPALLIDASNVQQQSDARSRDYTLTNFPGL